jgi:4-amino-4-deoxy-L-arabinose transferase-like glycosyltransferase
MERSSERVGPGVTLAVIGIAFVLRVYRLSEMPPGIDGDEAWNLMDILQMQRSRQFPIYFHDNNGREALFIYLQAIMSLICGATPFAARLTAAFVGTVTVALLYRFARALFGTGSWAPLASAAILTFTFYHVVSSRVGLRAISLSPMALASFLFL